MSSWKEKDEAYAQRPTRVFMVATMVQSCGHLNHEAMQRIRGAMIDAFTAAATNEGLTSTWALELKTKTPKDFDALLARRDMRLDEPSAAVPKASDEALVVESSEK